MLKLLNSFIILFIILNTILFAQDPILQGLNSPDANVRFRTLIKIQEEKLQQYGPALEERIFLEESPSMIYPYLLTLFSIQYENNETIALALIDTVNNYPPSTDPRPIKIKVLATYVLCKQFGNFSTIQYAFEILNSDYPYIMGEALEVMVLGLEVPEHFESCKNALLNIINSSKDPVSSMVAYTALTNKLGIQFAGNLVDGFQNDSSDVVRLRCLQQLCSLNYSDLNNLLKTRLPLEPYEGLRMDIIDTLLNKYGDPSDLKAVMDYQPNEPHPNAKSLMGFRTRNFIPHKFDQSATIEQMFLKINGYLGDLQNYNWLADETYKIELEVILTSAKTNLLAGDSLTCRTQVKIFQDLVDNVYKDSLNPDPRFVTLAGWKFLYWNAQYILDRLPEPPANPNLVVSLKSSIGTVLTTGSLQYYEGSWKDAISNGDGTFTIITNQNNVSLRMTYEYAQQTVNNIPAHNNTYTFQTVSANVQLKNSFGSLIDTGTVQYYAGAWRSFGTTTNGVAAKELLPINYSFRMTYEFASIDKQQNLSVDPTVVFQTVNAQVQLKNSLGNLLDVGTVQYYAGAWRNFGTTTNGVATKELLPINYSFRMTHAFLSKDKQQNISTNPVVDFATVLCSVKVSKTNNQPLNNTNVKYYAVAWRDLGVTNTEGITTKELLPQNISFRASYGSTSLDKQQDIGTNSLVEIMLNVP